LLKKTRKRFALLSSGIKGFIPTTTVSSESFKHLNLAKSITSRKNVSLKEIKILNTGITGFDAVLGGGIPVGSLVMLVGSPGTGKTIMIQQLCFAWARRQQTLRQQEDVQGKTTVPETPALVSSVPGKRKPSHKGGRSVSSKAIYFSTFSEPHDKLIEHISQMDFFDETFFVEDIRLLSLTSVMDEGLQKVADLIVDTVRHENAGFIAIDGFRALEGLASNPDAIRRFLYRLSAQLNLLGVTAVISLERSLADTSEGDLTIADAIIGLYNFMEGSRVHTRMEVRKVRGLRQLRGLHTYDISEKGWTIYPRFETLAPQLLSYSGAGSDDTRIGFGLPALEEMLGGGLPKGSTTLLAGALGVGKTLLSLNYLMEGAGKNEPGLYVGFYESADQLFNKAERFGINLREAVKSGKITLLNIAPVQLEPDVLAAQIAQEIEQHSIQRFILDGILEVELACLYGNRAHDFMAALVAYSKEKNITTIYTYKISKIVGPELDISNTSLSVLAENLFLLRQLERQGRFYRVMSILQMRDSAHEQNLREFTIDDNSGINIQNLVAEDGAPVSTLAVGYESDN
jgi:circadian clock protein KaiC